MIRNARGTLLRGLLAALMISAVFAGSAGAAPVWKFEEKSLEGTEAIVGGAEDSGMTVPGLTTYCDNFLYNLDIKNVSGTGQGSVTELPLFDCYTSSKWCTVDAIEAQSLPWSSNLTTVPLCTMPARSSASQLVRRMQPCDWVLPILSGSGVP